MGAILEPPKKVVELLLVFVKKSATQVADFLFIRLVLPSVFWKKEIYLVLL